MSEVWMEHCEGDEVRYSKTGQFAIVKEVDEENQQYLIDIDGTEYIAKECELSQQNGGHIL